MKQPGFKHVVWIAVGLVVAYLLAGPSVMDLWAYLRWKEIPCHTGSEGRFFYKIGEQMYGSTRRDFWQLKYTHEPSQGATFFDWDSTCWVSASDPNDAVHFLDAHRNWSNSLGRIFISGFLLACVAGVLHFGLKPRGSAAG